MPPAVTDAVADRVVDELLKHSTVKAISDGLAEGYKECSGEKPGSPRALFESHIRASDTYAYWFSVGFGETIAATLWEILKLLIGYAPWQASQAVVTIGKLLGDEELARQAARVFAADMCRELVAARKNVADFARLHGRLTGEMALAVAAIALPKVGAVRVSRLFARAQKIVDARRSSALSRPSGASRSVEDSRSTSGRATRPPVPAGGRLPSYPVKTGVKGRGPGGGGGAPGKRPTSTRDRGEAPDQVAVPRTSIGVLRDLLRRAMESHPIVRDMRQKRRALAPHEASHVLGAGTEAVALEVLRETGQAVNANQVLVDKIASFDLVSKSIFASVKYRGQPSWVLRESRAERLARAIKSYRSDWLISRGFFGGNTKLLAAAKRLADPGNRTRLKKEGVFPTGLPRDVPSIMTFLKERLVFYVPRDHVGPLIDDLFMWASSSPDLARTYGFEPGPGLKKQIASRIRSLGLGSDEIDAAFAEVLKPRAKGAGRTK